MYEGLIASKNHNIIYANMPKAGCTTIKNMIYYIDNGDFYPLPLDIHSDANALMKGKHNPILMEDKIKNRKLVFTMVRHPYKRVYSCFNEKIFYQSPHSFGKIRIFLQKEYKLNFLEQNYTLEKHIDNFEKFLIFLKQNLNSNTIIRKDPHWIPQSNLLASMAKDLNIDFVGRIERFQQDMSYVFSFVNTEVDLSIKFNEGPKPPFKYDEIISDKILSLLEEIYIKDLERFGYY